MERLTKRYIPNDEKNEITGIKVFESENKVPLVEVLSGEYLYPAIEKLATYEDLEEQGLLVRLPCKVGTEVFVIFQGINHYTKCQIKKIEISSTSFGKICYFAEPVTQRGCCLKYFDNEFGKLIFLTREEAEKKLEEMNKQCLIL